MRQTGMKISKKRKALSILARNRAGESIDSLAAEYLIKPQTVVDYIFLGRRYEKEAQRDGR